MTGENVEDLLLGPGGILVSGMEREIASEVLDHVMFRNCERRGWESPTIW